jgi:hypothetical protein
VNKMVIVNFTVFEDKVENDIKHQTIRRPRKGTYQIKAGDKLHLYWHSRGKDRRLLGTAICKEVKHVKYTDFAYDDKVAVLDGFKDSAEMRVWLNKQYKGKPDGPFNIISWDHIEKT